MGEFVTEVDLLIKSDAQLAALKQSQADLTALLKTAKDGGRDTAELEARLKDVNKALAEGTFKTWSQGLQQLIEQERAAGRSTADLEKQLEAVNKTNPLSGWGKVNEALRDELSKIPGVSAVTNMLNGSTAGVAAGFVVAAEAIHLAKEALAEYAQQEQAVAGMNAALANQGGFTKQISADLQELAGRMQDVTGIADEKWTAAIQKILTFPEADVSKIDQYVEGIKHLVAITGMDVDQASMLFGRAMAGNISGLHRYGIEVEASGDKTKDLQALMNELASRDGGILEARMKTLAGASQNLANVEDDLKKNFGNLLEKLLPIRSALEAAAEGLKMVADLLPGTVQQAGLLNNKLEDTTRISQAAKDATKQLADDGISKITKASQEAEAALQKTIQKLDELLRRRNEMVDAKAELEIARVNAGDGDYSKLTPSQKVLKVADIRADAEKQKQGNADEILKQQKAAYDKANKALQDTANAREKEARAAEKAAADMAVRNSAEDKARKDVELARRHAASYAAQAQPELDQVNEEIASGERSRVGSATDEQYARRARLQKEIQKYNDEEKAKSEEYARIQKTEKDHANEYSNDAGTGAANVAAQKRAEANAAQEEAVKGAGKANEDIGDRQDKVEFDKSISTVKGQTSGVTTSAQARPMKNKEAEEQTQKDAVNFEDKVGDEEGDKLKPKQDHGQKGVETDAAFSRREKMLQATITELNAALAKAQEDKGGNTAEIEVIISVLNRLLALVDTDKKGPVEKIIATFRDFEKRLIVVEAQVKNNRK